MTKLTDTQLTILSAASRRAGGVLALPDDLSDPEKAKLAKPLLKRKLVTERPSKGRMPSYRRDEQGRKLSLVITPAGLAAIGVEDAEAGQREHPNDDGGARTGTAADDTTVPSQAAPRGASKIGQVLALLGRKHGVSLGELAAATGWLPHTTRAALTGLRKRGHAIARERGADGGSIYRIAAGREAAASTPAA